MKFIVVLALIICKISSQCATNSIVTQFGWNGPTAVSGNNMNLITCVKDTQIDFNFPQPTLTALNGTTASGFVNQFIFQNNSVNNQVTLQYLNRNGLNASYFIKDITLSNYSAGPRVQITNFPIDNTIITNELSMTYVNSNDASQQVVVSILLADNSTIDPAANDANANKYLYRANASNAYSGISGFQTLVANMRDLNAGSTTLSGLSGLSIFNNMDLGHFYTKQSNTSSLGCTNNYLVNYRVYRLGIALAASIATSPFTGAVNTEPTTDTINLLCWGSNSNTGTFQTHMRDNFALWTAWFSVLIFWISMLFGEPTTLNCYDKKFQNNKWTCWSYYSLWFLAHEDFFTRMMRTVPVYINFVWQGCVIAILYQQIGQMYPYPSTIAWFGVIGWACSLPLSFIFGLFTNQVYTNQFVKFEQKEKIKKLFNKQEGQALIHEDNIDQCESRIFGAYYWMYVFAFACFITFFTLSINRLQVIPRQYYYQQYYWIAALGVAWGIDIWIAQPLFALILGNTAFYRFRPYFYNEQMGQLYKAIQS